MAEDLGAIVSIITIAQALKPILSLAGTIYKTQKELQDVQVGLRRGIILRTAANTDINVILDLHTDRGNRRIL